MSSTLVVFSPFKYSLDNFRLCDVRCKFDTWLALRSLGKTCLAPSERDRKSVISDGETKPTHISAIQTRLRRTEVSLNDKHSPCLHPLKTVLTSNCHFAACSNCFACSAWHPAANTNWLIITCCLRLSMIGLISVFLTKPLRALFLTWL